MCGGRIAPAALLAALAVGGLAMPAIGAAACAPTSADGAARPACLACLADSLHDAADMIEGLIEREA